MSRTFLIPLAKVGRLTVRLAGLFTLLTALLLWLTALSEQMGFVSLASEMAAWARLDSLWLALIRVWDWAIKWLGLTAWLLPVVLLVTALALLLEQGQGIWVLRTAGWALLLLTGNLSLACWTAEELQPFFSGRLGTALYIWASQFLDASLLRVLVPTIALLAIWLALDRMLLQALRLLLRYIPSALRERAGPSQSPLSSRPPVAASSAKQKAVPRKIEDIPIRVYTRPVKDAQSHETIAASLEQASESATQTATKLPPLTLLDDPDPFPIELHEQKLRERAAKLEQTFADFGYHVRVVGINTGPVITQYEIALETGLRVNKITCLADDLALNLKVPSVRIVAPIPGKDTVGIEIPNDYRATVRMKEVLQAAATAALRMKIPLFLGKDTEGQPLVYDLADMPHLLIAGRTGTGKSVCMNAIILSILMTRRPDEVQMIMIDPKMLELSEYGNIPHLIHPVVKDVRKAEAILAWAVDKMEERYDLLSRARVRNIAAYNELSEQEIYRRLRPEEDEEKARIPKRMPYIVIFVDEMNDLMMTMRKEVEGHIIRLAQKSRAAGIHLVVATQKPTVDVITGLIKSNLPARICFQVSSRSDSRVVLDEIGAEKLLGKGDMLFLQPGTSTLIRAQGTYASDREITRIVEYLAQEPCFSRELIQLSTASKKSKDQDAALDDRRPDELYEQAVEIVIREQRGSVSLLQRVLGIGYGRAARLIDWMAEDGIVGGYNGSNARQVLIKPEEWDLIKAQRWSGTRLDKDV
ncbi:MAG: DNA translocase FtsK [Gemmatales bacterium]|nr:DNA translocase FtsK [Gemmatales bacterium]MDW8221651.1 DNA translocase FtsK [Gemmatales bacterium]